MPIVVIMMDGGRGGASDDDDGGSVVVGGGDKGAWVEGQSPVGGRFGSPMSETGRLKDGIALRAAVRRK